MFKRLRERIAEEANKQVGQLAFGGNSRPLGIGGQVNESSEDLITLSDNPAVIDPHPSPQQFSIAEDEDGSLSEPTTPQKKLGNSASELTPGASYKDHLSVINNNSSIQKNIGSPYIPQTDIESEVDDPPTLNLDGISKEQLLTSIQLLKARLCKYKNKYSEVVKAYKASNEDKKKLEHALTDNQDKSLRRIAELREQCHLEQKAKAHLEENLRLILEEKESRISVLETQINLLKEGQSESFVEQSGTMTVINDIISGVNDESGTQDKVSQLTSMLKEYESTISTQKEQISKLTDTEESLHKQLDDLQKASEELKLKETKFRAEHEELVLDLRKQLMKLQEQQEESVMSMAETKKNMHEELELKERQLTELKEEARQLHVALDNDKATIANLTRLHDEKLIELKSQLVSMEKTMEEEKENLIREFSRGKAEAVALIQLESSNKVAALEEQWSLKLHKQQTDHEVALEEKEQLLQQKVQELHTLEEKLRNVQEEFQQVAEQKETTVTSDTASQAEEKPIRTSETASQAEVKPVATSETASQAVEKVATSETASQAVAKVVTSETASQAAEKAAVTSETAIQVDSIQPQSEFSVKDSADDRLNSLEAKYKKEIMSLQGQISELKEHNSRLAQEIQNMVSVTEKFKTKQNEQQRELEDKGAEVEELEGDLDRCRKELEQCKAKLSEEIELRKNAVSKLEKELSSMSSSKAAEVESLQRKVQQLEKERELLMIQAQERVADTEIKYRKDIEELNEKLKQLQLKEEEIIELKKQNSVLSTQFDESLLVSAANQAQAAEELALTKKQLDMLKQDVASKSKLCESLKAKLQSANNDSKEKSSTLDHVRQEMDSLVKKLSNKGEELRKCKEQLNGLNEQIESLRQENERLKAELVSFKDIKKEKDSLEVKAASLEQFKEDLSQTIEQLKGEYETLRTSCRCSDCSCGKLRVLTSENGALLSKVREYDSQVSQCSNCETLKSEVNNMWEACEKKLVEKDQEFQQKMKAAMMEFTEQVKVKNQDYDHTVSELLDKNQALEDQLLREHRLEVAALRQDIFEKDCALEEVREHYEEVIKEKDAEITSYKERLSEVKEVNGLRDSRSQHPVGNGDVGMTASNEVSDWDDTWVVPEESCGDQTPPPPPVSKTDCEGHIQQIESMQKELTKCNSELKDLRVLLRLSNPPQPPRSSSNSSLSNHVPEATEFEYLRNILFEYMMGKETVTLVKVIAAVLRFSEEQTQLIVEREKAKQPPR